MSHPKSSYVLDARFLEPPEPFVKTMEALDSLPEGARLLLLLYREPHPLYRVLDQNVYRYETEQVADGTFEILIWPA